MTARTRARPGRHHDRLGRRLVGLFRRPIAEHRGRRVLDAPHDVVFGQPGHPLVRLVVVLAVATAGGSLPSGVAEPGTGRRPRVADTRVAAGPAERVADVETTGTGGAAQRVPGAEARTARTRPATPRCEQ